jgi:hypothetical protein
MVNLGAPVYSLNDQTAPGKYTSPERNRGAGADVISARSPGISSQ